MEECGARMEGGILSVFRVFRGFIAMGDSTALNRSAKTYYRFLPTFTDFHREIHETRERDGTKGQ